MPSLQEERNHKLLAEIIAHYSHKFFLSKKILVLGEDPLAGISLGLARLGAIITVCDVRQETLDKIKKQHSFIATVKADLETQWPFKGQNFDLVLSLSLANHLKNIEKHIKDILSCGEEVVLETEVLNVDEEKTTTIFEEKSIAHLSYHGECSIVSAKLIENRLSAACATYKRMDKTSLNHGQMIYDWKQGTGPQRKYGQQRFWFIRRDAFFAQKQNLPIFPQPIGPAPVPSSPPVSLEQQRVTEAIYTPVVKNEPPKNLSNSTDPPVMRLFYNYYEDISTERKNEIDYCLNQNLDNKSFRLIVIESPLNPTYKFLFDKINLISGPDDINIICNSDIFFDDTIKLANNIKHKEIYALTCWDWRNPNDIKFRNEKNSQDTWIFRGPVHNVKGDFQIGTWACDNRIAYEFHKAKYKVINPSLSIKTYHYQNSGVRRHSPKNAVPGPHLFVVPIAFS